MADTEYFYADGNQQRGPHSAAEVIAMGLSPGTLVWREGMAGWQPISTVPELNPPPAPASEPPPAPMMDTPPPLPPGSPHNTQPVGYGGYAPAPPRDNSNKLLAGVLGIVLGVLGFGGLGIHKFVLGYNQAGVIMLSVTLGGTFLGCCFAPLLLLPIAMSIIAIVEGIMYLCKSDAEFYDTYVVRKREWF